MDLSSCTALVVGASTVAVGVIGEKILSRRSKRARDLLTDTAEPNMCAVLPNHVDGTTANGRKEGVLKQRQAYQLVFTEFCSPFLKGPPLDEIHKPEAKRSIHIMGELASGTIESFLKMPTSMVTRNFAKDVDPFDAWLDMMPTDFDFGPLGKRESPLVYKTWKTDEGFAACRLNGTVPFLIKRFTSKMDNFPVTDATVNGLLPKGENLSTMMKKGLLYICDYVQLEGIPVKPEFEGCFAVPIALFGVIDGRLMPLAIQISQHAGSPIFTPKDDATQWLLAKMFVGQADIHVHAMSIHVMSCHLFTETIHCVSRRNLHKTHPVYQLLEGHFFFTATVNYTARLMLINPTGLIPHIYACGYEGQTFATKFAKHNFDWNEWNPAKDFKKRGVDETKKLPNYYFRDDALKLQDIIVSFVTKFVEETYVSEEDLLADYELQNFTKELMAIQKWGDIPIDPTTRTFLDRQSLIQFLSDCIFTVSGRHSAVNNPQFDYHGFIPAYPVSLKVKVPQDKLTKYTEAEIAAGLPNWKMSALNIALVMALSMVVEPDRRLGEYNNDLLVNRPLLAPTVDRYLKKPLAEMTDIVRERNSKLKKEGKMPYYFLDPLSLSGSIEI